MSVDGGVQAGQPAIDRDDEQASGARSEEAPAAEVTAGPRASQLLALQATAGNRAVNALLLAADSERVEQRAVLGRDMAVDGLLARPERAAAALRHAPSLLRTPAPPSFGGRTGVRDLTKIRVDAVPDFTLGSLTSPRAVNPHVTDAAIVHISWEFYDPADQLLPGSFSMLPGRPTSTTAPFALEASQFGGQNFRPGRYLLRLVGRDAQHRPVAYADRDFNVMQADLTTGTAAATGHGQLTFTRYSATQAPSIAGTWNVDVELSFTPDAAVQSTDVVFIQAGQFTRADGESFHRFTNAEMDARQTPLAWSIDRVAGAPEPFYISGRNSAGAVADIPAWGRAGRGGAAPRPATLIDQPGGPAAPAVQMKFESCAVSRSGATAGECYGCATWGLTVDATGRVTLMPRSLHPLPSPEFEEARQMWNSWRAGRPAASRPTEAPAIRSP